MFTPQNARELGKRGGQATVKKHGKGHMSKIGRKGARVFHERYTLQPVGLCKYAIVNRENGSIVNTLCGQWKKEVEK